jgi:hypothetical protein
LKILSLLKNKSNPFYKPPVGSLPRRQLFTLFAAVSSWLTLGSALSAQEEKPKGGKGGRDPKETGDDSTKARGPAFVGDYVLPSHLEPYAQLSVILGRATDRSITFSLLSKEKNQECFFEIGTQKNNYTRKTVLTLLPETKVVEVLLQELEPNTEYFYRLNYRESGTQDFLQRSDYRFATGRAPGSTFVFTIQGDSHPERPQSSHPELYARTLQTAASDQPDFHICIGDDFSVEKYRQVSAATMAEPYLLQRPFLGLVGQTAPIFLMNGNHEQASLFNYQQTDVRKDVATFVQTARNQLYPTVGPDGFYTGNQETLPDIGLLKDYCAWTWGDGLFIILDNYWHSAELVDSGYGAKGGGGKEKKEKDWWKITIGNAQYQWLKKTLETSKAKYKFVFAHHVLGSGRGGVDEADLYEWGGKGKKGEGSFAQMRPTWELPLHQLMVKHGVNVFFQGHDHLYCQQEKDGIIYQEVPMPSDHNYTAYNDDRYQSGTKLPSTGHIRVTVAPHKVKVEYVRSFLAKDESETNQQGMIAHAYELKSKNG